MEFFDTYMNEIAIGGSGAVGTLIVTILKRFANRFDRMEKRINELEKKLEINTALDKERSKNN